MKLELTKEDTSGHFYCPSYPYYIDKATGRRYADTNLGHGNIRLCSVTPSGEPDMPCSCQEVTIDGKAVSFDYYDYERDVWITKKPSDAPSGLLGEMRQLKLRFSRVAGGRIYFAYIPTGDEWLYFKSWDEVRNYIETRKAKGVANVAV